MTDIFSRPLPTRRLSKSVCGFTRFTTMTASAARNAAPMTTFTPSALSPTSVTSIDASIGAPTSRSVTP
jgi:hypothetical protein